MRSENFIVTKSTQTTKNLIRILNMCKAKNRFKKISSDNIKSKIDNDKFFIIAVPIVKLRRDLNNEKANV